MNKSFIDEYGVQRHAMNRKEIESLYRQLDNFIGDCTVEEVNANSQAFIAVKTLLHQRMQ